MERGVPNATGSVHERAVGKRGVPGVLVRLVGGGPGGEDEVVQPRKRVASQEAAATRLAFKAVALQPFERGHHYGIRLRRRESAMSS